MADWQLAFERPRSAQPLTVGSFAQLLTSVTGGPVESESGPREGNPYDYYTQKITLTARCQDSDVHLAMTLTDNDNPAPTTEINSVTLQAATASFATKLATWHALRDALAAIGCIDKTLVDAPAPIVDDAEAAGDMATAKRLRAEITAARIAMMTSPSPGPYVYLSSPRVDNIDTVLAAHPAPDGVEYVFLYDCELSTIPAGLARFPNIKDLRLVDKRIEASALRGASFANVTCLVVTDTAIERLGREELVGFPLLEELYVARSPLEQLDPEITVVCPRLQRMVIDETPLEQDAEQMAALRARWPGVTWQPRPSTL